ncbi:transposase [Malacoplasma iowae]|uniref:transposase n=1 Tax=Malacoplasma iowae TaxID=2116 RepID=UPI003873CA21
MESTLDAEFNEHIGYQKYDQNSRDIYKNYKKEKTKKTISTDNGKIDIQVPRDELYNIKVLQFTY